MNLIHRIAAYRDLWAHYYKTFAFYWTRRKASGSGFFTEHEAEFLPAALALQEAPVSSTAKLTGRILMLLVVAALLWSVIGRVDIVVNASGKIIPCSRVKTIASVDIASVKALHVTEGESVRTGDLLVELDSSASDSERDKAVGDRSMAVLQVARSHAMITAIGNDAVPQWPSLEILRQSDPAITQAQWDAERAHLDGLYRDFLAKRERIDGEIARYAEALPIASKRADDYKSLLKDHDIAEHAWMEKEQARIDLEGQLRDAKHQRATLLAETRSAAYEQMTEGNKLAASSKQDALRSNSHSKLLKLVAPVDGTVQQLSVHTVGGVVPAAQPLMQIVPTTNVIEVEASIENKDIGFVQEGQTAQVKIAAFEYTKYGTIPAKVTHVSRDAIQDEKRGLLYMVKVTLDRDQIDVDGRTVPLSAGMAVNVDIKTGDRRIIDYVLTPLMEHQSESLHER